MKKELEHVEEMEEVEMREEIHKSATTSELPETSEAALDGLENYKEAAERVQEDAASEMGEGGAYEERTAKRSFWPPSREQLFTLLPFVGFVLLGAILRFWGLGDKPLHHDESLHAYFGLQLMHNLESWSSCFNTGTCYHYDPLTHGPFQFHIIAFFYKISQLLQAPDYGVNTFTVRIAAATLGTVIVALPYFLRDYLGKVGAVLASGLLAVSPSMVYFSRFAREDIYMACFTLLLVVALARYIRTRKMGWLVTAAAAFSLSYATKEATFLTIAIFGSFFAALFMWEAGLKVPVRSVFERNSDGASYKFLPRTAAPLAVVLLGIVTAPLALLFFRWLKDLAIYIADPKNTPAADAFVEGLKAKTVFMVPWVGILLGIFVLTILAREVFGKLPPPGRRGLARWIDPKRQPLLDTIFTMQWTHWFFALLCGWAIFLILFTVVFTNIGKGIGDGIWAGIYYWLKQQQVARGDQPWYYYFMLIPLYEQIGLVFGFVGLVRSIVRPTKFRLFVSYWFVGNVFLYTWAAEKMPWLMIHMTMPMLLLAAIGLEPAVVTTINLVRQWRTRNQSKYVEASEHSEGAEERMTPVPVPVARPKVEIAAASGAVVTLVLAVLLLLPTLHNMYEVTYVHAADGPHEMMVYVQTTTDVNIVMSKLDALDQKVSGGRHQLVIGVMSNATWPFAWYVRDYQRVCWGYVAGSQCFSQSPDVVLAGAEDIDPARLKLMDDKVIPSYLFHQYHMRSWWDEGYKPPACVPTPIQNCAGEPTWGGVGPGLWLSYGDNPPKNATFNLGLAARNIWQWWWDRKAFGSTDGNYDMGLFIRSDLGMTP